MNKKVTIFLLVIILLGSLTAFGWWWHLEQTRQRVVEAVPPVPALENARSQTREAIQETMARIESSREPLPALRHLAQLYHANGFIHEALHCYEALEWLDPDEPKWLHLKALILAGFGEVEPALESWYRVVELAPDYVSARLRLADTALKANRIDEAQAAYEAILQRWPDEAYALLGLARIDFEAERWEAARTKLEKLVEQTNYRLGYDLIVSVYERLGMHSKAREIRGSRIGSGGYRDAPDPWFDELIHICYDPYRIAIVAGTIDDQTLAHDLLLRAIAIEPDEVAYRLQLVSLHTDRGDTAAAMKELRVMTQIAPHFADGWVRLSAFLKQQGNQDAAVRTLLEGLKHCPDSPTLRMMWGGALREAGRFEASIEQLKIAVQLRPNEAEGYIELSQSYVAKGEVQAGLAQLRRALQVEPDNPTAITFLAFHAISTKNKSDADHWMRFVDRQPRVRSDASAYLTNAYNQAFGIPWKSQ